MFEKIKEINKISKGFYFHKDKVLYQNDKCLIESNISDLSNLLLYNFKEEVSIQKIVRLRERKFIFLSGSGRFYVMDLNREPVIQKIELRYVAYDIFNDKYLVSLNDQKKGVFDVFKQKTIWEISTEGNLFIDNKNKVYLLKFDSIEKLEFNNGKVVWSLNLDKKLKTLPKVLFEFKSTLILSISEDILIGLDTKSGSIVWQIDECNNTNYVLDKRDGKLKGVTSIGYFEVEIKTGVYKRTLFEPMEKLFNDPTIFDSQRDNFVLVNNHIITTDCKRGIIGAFNTKTLQYDWFHEEKGVSFSGVYPIKYFEPYLFVMDSKETLHIFKKEDINV